MSEVNLREITREEVLKHDGLNNSRLWIIINGNVYDVTTFKHPGGREALEDDHGDDRGDEFDSIHSDQARKDAKKYLIGVLKKEIPTPKGDSPKKNQGDISSENKSNTSVDCKNQQKSILLPFIIIILAYFILFKFNLLGLFNKPTPPVVSNNVENIEILKDDM